MASLDGQMPSVLAPVPRPRNGTTGKLLRATQVSLGNQHYTSCATAVVARCAIDPGHRRLGRRRTPISPREGRLNHASPDGMSADEVIKAQVRHLKELVATARQGRR
jgi:hypothetical protein